MFVQSAHFVERHRESPSDEISLFGRERIAGNMKDLLGEADEEPDVWRNSSPTRVAQDSTVG